MKYWYYFYFMLRLDTVHYAYKLVCVSSYLFRFTEKKTCLLWKRKNLKALQRLDFVVVSPPEMSFNIAPSVRYRSQNFKVSVYVSRYRQFLTVRFTWLVYTELLLSCRLNYFNRFMLLCVWWFLLLWVITSSQYLTFNVAFVVSVNAARH